jgi:Na+-driven multidrug efflux pump
MMNRNFSLPWIGLFAATRIALGVGIGLLISRRLSRDEAKAAGVALTVMGGLTTIPFIVGVIARQTGEVSEIRPTA